MYLLILLFPFLLSSTFITIDIKNLGLLYGKSHTNHNTFLNIPYIEPPIMQNRWKPPVPKQAWHGMLNATEYGPGCPQRCMLPESACPVEMSEDCVQLNVFTPVDLNASYPVMVFFPGGAFTQGTAGFDLYNGRFYAERDVVVVTVNYRLGALGYLSTPETLGGNFGTLDQIEALKFVQKYIQYFGGNPNDVTIFGQSAGAVSVGILLVSPLADGLFHKAIMQSNPFTIPLKSNRSAMEQGNRFLLDAKCKDDIKCLQSLPLETILSIQSRLDSAVNIPHLFDTLMQWAPRTETSIIPDYPFYSILKGDYHKVPIILGAVSNEGIPFVELVFSSKLKSLVYSAAVTATFGANVGSTLLTSFYPVSVFGDNRENLANLVTDYIFICPTRNISMSLAQNSENIYLYHYSHAESFDAWGERYSACVGKVCHSADLFLSWGTPPLFGFPFTEEEQKLSNLMIDHWTNFARTGNPIKGNRPNVINWPSISSAPGTNINFATPAQLQTNWQQKPCDFFDSKGYQFGWKIF